MDPLPPRHDIRPDATAACTPAERELLRRAAIERAHVLRDETIHGFWRAAERRLAEAADPVRRAARRLVARLRQHARLRERA